MVKRQIRSAFFSDQVKTNNNNKKSNVWTAIQMSVSFIIFFIFFYRMCVTTFFNPETTSVICPPRRMWSNLASVLAISVESFFPSRGCKQRGKYSIFHLVCLFYFVFVLFRVFYGARVLLKQTTKELRVS